MRKASKNKKKSRASSGGGRSRAARIALWVGGAVLLAAILLAAAGSFTLHRILTTGKIKEWVSEHPEELRLEYASASGWFPWAVRVRALELRGRDPNVEWYFRIDDVRLSFSPLALLTRHFHATHVRGNGLTFRLRIRPEPPQPPAAHFAALPPIPGFAARPLSKEAETKAPSNRPPGGPSKDHPFRVDIDDLRIGSVEEVWIDLYRFRGGGTLDGSFDLIPPRHAEVGPSRLLLSAGDLTLGPHILARRATFETRAVIRQYDPRLVRGSEVWPFASGRVRLDGSLAGLEFLNYFLEGGDPRLSGGAGSARLAIDVAKGRGTGTLTLEARAAAARYRTSNLRGNVTVRMRFNPWEFEKNHIDVSGTRIELTNISSAGPGPDSRDWWGRFELPTADIRSAHEAVFAAKIAIRCRDARPLFTLFDTNLPGWARGVLKLDGLEATARVGFGKGLLDVEQLDAAGGSFRIRGRYRSRREERRGAVLVETGALALGVDIEGKSSKLKLLNARSWYEGEAARASASAQANGTARGKSGRP